MNRKEWKRMGLASLKRHYLIFMFLCLLLAALGLEYGSSLQSVRAMTHTGTAQVSHGERERSNAFQVWELITSGNVEGGEELSHENLAQVEAQNTRVGIVDIGHSRGVLSLLVNQVVSGEIVYKLFDAIRSTVRAENAAMAVFIVLCTLFYCLVYFYFFNIIEVVYKRFFMEGRLYGTLPVRRFLFFARAKKWNNAALTVLLRTIYHFLWCLTVVGGIIKSYSYALVPYILCENPAIRPNDVITLSRRMMKGHKWELFKLQLSFLGWQLLGWATLGLGDLFFTNPYMEATFAEYYAYLRQLAKEAAIPGSELLNDEMLYRKADEDTLRTAYADAIDRPALPQKQTHYTHPVRRFLADVLGVILTVDDVELNYREATLRQEQDARFADILAGEQYPGRLFPIPTAERDAGVENVSALRHYSLTSLILIFFSLCFVGWLWEVSLHLIADGRFVNRGVLHGPWLPIYGTGSVLILMLLNLLRKKPPIEFVSAIILCGLVEYSTAWYLEVTHGGQKWWDYSGYFLNIHGRVCAEGLLVFGLGGIAVVYLLAPLLDDWFRRIPRKLTVTLCVVLLCVYGADQIYSGKHPNTGKGITDYIPVVSHTDAGTMMDTVLQGSDRV